MFSIGSIFRGKTMADAEQSPSSKALMNNPAVNLATVLRDERDEVERLCKNRGAQPDLSSDDHDGIPHRLGLALSGGGIRSACVNLGLIQGLAKVDILKQVHYISGISGGGYILGWLTSWIRRSGYTTVENQLAGKSTLEPNASEHPPAGQLATAEQTPTARQSFAYARFLEPNPIRHLREYASYLTPRMGLGSGDTLAMISIYLRNVLLNQALVLSAVACVIALVQMLAPWSAWRGPAPCVVQVILLLIGLGSGMLAGALTGNALNCLGTDQEPKYEPKKAGMLSALAALLMAICLWVILPTTFGDKLFACSFVPAIKGHPVIAGSSLAGLLVFVMYLFGFLRDTFGKKELLGAVNRSTRNVILAALAAIVLAAAFLSAVVFGFAKWLLQDTQVYVGDWYVMLGLPAIMLAMALASYVHIGIFGDVFPDAKREWLGRQAGYYLYFATIIAAVMIGALRGPVWMHLLFKGLGASTGTGAWLKWILPGGWLFTVLCGLLAGVSPRTGENSPDKNIGDSSATRQSRPLDILAKIAPPVFLAGVFLLVSWGVYTLAGYSGAPKYLTWVEDTDKDSIDGDPILKLVKPAADANTTLLYPAAPKDSLKNRKSIFELRGCLWQQNATEGAPACPSSTPTPTPVPTPVPQKNDLSSKPPVVACVPDKTSAGCQPMTKELPKESNEQQAPECAPPLGDLLAALFSVAGAAFLIALVLLFRLDANEFSMHLFYRNRLVRAFLGASNVKSSENSKGRRPSPFTGFALDDDVPLQELYSKWERENERENECHDLKSPKPATMPSADCYDGPYPIWGTALNLTAGEDLAWQKRKAASFIYSPLYCGWDYVGKTPASLETPDEDTQCNEQQESSGSADRCKYAYRSTGKFTSSGCERIPYTGHGCGPSIGTAMAASGAAISPNWGYHTSPAVAALLAIFNVRIGWWTGNPRRKDSWDQYAPGAGYLTAELLGSTTDAGKYVYLSDGGHFENLGIYELVRRRMKYIIACDADADPDYSFEDLANAVEKCRRDFGVKIEIDTSAIKPGKSTQLSKAHFAIGKITYPPLSGEKENTGVLLYLKSSLTGDESADVLGQRAVDNKFPHDTTVNQFFNETQFEVYRALGEHMFETLWEYHKKEAGENFASPNTKPKDGVNSFFKQLNKDREKRHNKKTEKQQQALHPEA
jgi:hypothetical protein